MVLMMIKRMLSNETETQTPHSTALDNPYDTSALTRQKLNELLAKTPRIPTESAN